MKQHIHWIGSVVGFACLSSLPIRSHSANFEVIGETVNVAYKDGLVADSGTNTFKISVKGCKFLVRTYAPGKGIEYSEFGSETNYSFHFTKYVDSIITNSTRVVDGVATEAPLKKPGKARNDSGLNLNPTLAPIFTTDITPVWMAYAYQCYLADRKDGMIQPPMPQDSLDFRERHWRWSMAPARWRLSGAAPGLLESLVIYRDGGTLLLPAPFKGRTTNIVYEVLQWTNFGGLTIPREFKITRYALDLMAKDAPRLMVEGIMRGWTKQITNGISIARLGPTISSRTRVVDNRWEAETGSPNGFIYMATEGRLLELDELIKLQERQR